MTVTILPFEGLTMKAITPVVEIYHYLMLEVIIRKNSSGSIAYRFAEQVSLKEDKEGILIRLGKKPAANKISGEDLFYDYEKKRMFFCYRDEKKRFRVGMLADNVFGLTYPAGITYITDLPEKYISKGIDQLRSRFKSAMQVDINREVDVFLFHSRFRKALAASMKHTEHIDIVPDSIEAWALNQPDVIRNRLLLIQAKERFKNSIVINT